MISGDVYRQYVKCWTNKCNGDYEEFLEALCQGFYYSAMNKYPQKQKLSFVHF